MPCSSTLAAATAMGVQFCPHLEAPRGSCFHCCHYTMQGNAKTFGAHRRAPLFPACKWHLVLWTIPSQSGATVSVLIFSFAPFQCIPNCTCPISQPAPQWFRKSPFLPFFFCSGFSVTSGGQTRIFKPISVQTMW